MADDATPRGEKPPQAATSLVYSSQDTPRQSRFQEYRELYANGADAIETGPGFSASMRAWRFDRMVLFDRHLRDISHERAPLRVRRDGFDHFTVQLTRSGESYADPGDGFRRVAPGEIILMDMTRPTRNRTPAAHIMTLGVARELMLAAAPLDNLHGLILPRQRAALVADYMVSLSRHAPRMSPDMASGAVRAMVELLGGAIDPTRSPARSERVLVDNLRRDKARRFIEAHLDAPELGPSLIAAAADVSRATLYRVFEIHGGIGKYVQTRRLARLRTLLADRSERRPLAELSLACGLGGESHCSRLFQQAFDMRPGEFRTAVLDGRAIQADAALDAKRKMAVWIADLR